MLVGPTSAALIIRLAPKPPAKRPPNKRLKPTLRVSGVLGLCIFLVAHQLFSQGGLGFTLDCQASLSLCLVNSFASHVEIPALAFYADESSFHVHGGNSRGPAPHERVADRAAFGCVRDAPFHNPHRLLRWVAYALAVRGGNRLLYLPGVHVYACPCHLEMRHAWRCVRLKPGEPATRGRKPVVVPAPNDQVLCFLQYQLHHPGGRRLVVPSLGFFTRSPLPQGRLRSKAYPVWRVCQY
jgi:hypothetical protein